MAYRASGPYSPEKPKVIAWANWLESLLEAGMAGLAYDTLAHLNADLAHGTNSTAVVYADATAANNGLYVKSGGSGSGSWTRIGDLPNSVIRLTTTGGTGDAATATAPETPTAPGSKLFIYVPSAGNTGGAMTLEVNGVSAPVKNNLGSNPAANTFVSGVPAVLIWQTDHYQALISVAVDTAGVVAAAVAARDLAEDYKDAAEAAASALGNQVHQYDTRALAAAATIPVGVAAIKVTRYATGYPLSYATYIPGTISGPMAFQEAGGHYWQLDLTGKTVDVLWFGAKGDGVADDTAVIHAARTAAGVGGKVKFPPLSYKVGGLTANVTGQRWLIDGATLTRINTNSTPLLTLNGAALTIDGGVLDGNNGASLAIGIVTTSTGQDFTWRRGELKNTTSWGIACDDNEMVLEDCYIHNTAFAGVIWRTFAARIGPKIRRCKVDRASGYVSSGGILCNDVVGAGTAIGTEIKDCDVTLGSNSVIDAVAIEMGFTVQGRIIGNKVDTARIALSAETCSGLVMTGNASVNVRSYAHEVVNCEWTGRLGQLGNRCGR